MKKCGIPENDAIVVKYRFKTEDPETSKFKELEDRIAALEEEISSGSGLDERIEKLENLYGVGAIWITVSDENPGTIFGGTWVKLEDRFLLCSGQNNAGATGGSNAVRQIELTADQLPAHNHHENEAVIAYNTTVAMSNLASPGAGHYMASIGFIDQNYDDEPTHYEGMGNTSNQNDSSGVPVDDDYAPSFVEVDIVPAYTTVNVWKRTA